MKEPQRSHPGGRQPSPEDQSGSGLHVNSNRFPDRWMKWARNPFVAFAPDAPDKTAAFSVCRASQLTHPGKFHMVLNDQRQQRDSTLSNPHAKGKPVALTPQQIIDTVVVFEKDLAKFYIDLPREPALKPLEKIFRFIAQHSEIHAEMIANYRSDAKIPQLDVNPLATLHDRLKESLKEELTSAANSADAARKMAEAEEILSRAYDKIAAHYEEVGDSYKMIASKFKSLADDERQHGKYIRKHI